MNSCHFHPTRTELVDLYAEHKSLKAIGRACLVSAGTVHDRMAKLEIPHRTCRVLGIAKRLPMPRTIEGIWQEMLTVRELKGGRLKTIVRQKFLPLSRRKPHRKVSH